MKHFVRVNLLKGHISRLSAQIWMGFSVLHLHSRGQQFQTKIKISICLVKSMFFKQNAKISGIPSLHPFIPAVVIIIVKLSISPKMYP